MKTAWTHTTLHDFEPTSFTKDDVGARDPNIVEQNFAMTLRRIIETEDG
jgi:hypothetical protein